MRRGYLGIAGADIRLPGEVVGRLGLPHDRAVLAIRVDACSPAARAGVREGDAIVALDAKPLTGVAALTRLLDGESIGRPAELAVVRSGQRIELRVTPREIDPAN